MGKLDLKKKLKHETLFNTAFDLFTTQGIYKTTISDIVKKAGVAKGTFYLYFTDKYDLRNKLISHKASILFENAYISLKETNVDSFEDKIIFMVDHIVDALNEDASLLTFISKNLSWGVFKSALLNPSTEDDLNFIEVYEDMLEDSPYTFKNPEVMLFMIVELVGSTVHSAILTKEPVDLETFKPYLYDTIRYIIEAQKL